MNNVKEIREYKDYKYIVYENNDIFFLDGHYIATAYKDLEKMIKNKISKTSNNFENTRNYYCSKEYCNSIIEKILNKQKQINEDKEYENFRTRELEIKYNVISDDEDVIGKVSNLKKYFLEQIKYTIEDTKISDEEKIYNVELMAELLDELQRQAENVVVKVKYNPMGAFYIADSLDS